MSSNRFKVYSTYRNEWNLDKHEFDLKVNQNHTLAREELLKEVKGCDAIITSPRFPLDKEVIEAAGDQLKVISLNSSGYNHIDVDECKKRGILIGYCPNTFAGEHFRDSVAEFTIGLILSAARSIPNSLSLGREMAWNYIKDNKLLREKPIRGSVIGVFGLGRIGLGVAKRLTPFGISKVIYTNRQESEEGAKLGYEFVPFDRLLEESDFLICSASVNKHNEKIFDIDAFKKMKPSSVFVNVGRGTMVNQDDLYQALTKNIISAAALDVTTPEPLGKDHPLYSLPNCYITPHIAGLDHLTREEMKKVVVTNIINGLNGKPLVHQVL